MGSTSQALFKPPESLTAEQITAWDTQEAAMISGSVCILAGVVLGVFSGGIGYLIVGIAAAILGAGVGTWGAYNRMRLNELVKQPKDCRNIATEAKKMLAEYKPLDSAALTQMWHTDSARHSRLIFSQKGLDATTLDGRMIALAGCFDELGQPQNAQRARELSRLLIR